MLSDSARGTFEEQLTVACEAIPHEVKPFSLKLRPLGYILSLTRQKVACQHACAYTT